MNRTVRFGLRLPQDVTDAAELRDLAQTAEQLGYHSLWLYDHFYHFPVPDNRTILEPWTLMSVLAGATRSIRVGTLVLCNAYRPPALLAKMAATLDVLSEGRLELGYGAGWHQEEFGGYGYDFPPVAVRIRQMEEGLTVMKRLWTEEQVSWSGRFYHLDGAICEPKPVQRPHPPVTIGGGGERLLLRAVARAGHAGHGRRQGQRAILHDHCRAIGRDPASVQQSLLTPTVTAE